MENEQKVNQLARKIGTTLIDSGMKFIQSSFHLEPIKKTSGDISALFKKYLPGIPINHLDNNYYTVPISQWKQMIEVDWTETKKWVEDKFDCDNFANYFSANMAMFYEINSVGRVYGKYYKGTQQFVDYHYWNVIITSDNEVYFFEPISGKLSEVKYEGGMILINGNKYEPISIYLG